VIVDVNKRRTGELLLNVRDHGVGIYEADMGQLFQPFSRLAAGRDMAKGNGLGLANSKQ
jgi:signal transduction histidine kinase